MADELKDGDRVTTRRGQSGTIIRIDDAVAHVRLDSSLNITTWVGSLKKIANDDAEK